jgi:hypothetical protein
LLPPNRGALGAPGGAGVVLVAGVGLETRHLGQCRSLAAQCLIVVDQYSSGNRRVVTDRSASVMIQMRSPSAVL